MAKNGGLWDDSALVKALDDAVSKYKIMHEKGGDYAPKDDRSTEDAEESSQQHNDAKSAFVETDNMILTEKCTSEVIEKHTGLLNGDQIQDLSSANFNAESAEHYNLLLNEYNAVEEQRQKLLEQLYQYGNWDPQGYGYGAGYGYDSQYQIVPAPQTSGAPICSCRPYVCPYSTSLAHNGNSASVKDDGFIKAAMGAVDEAIHSFDKQTSEGKKEQEVETTSQTDLSVVLNAWFSAGFYTGKYLSEQASTKK